MRPYLLLLVLLPLLALAPQVGAAEPEFPLTADSKPQPDVPKGEIIKDTYTVKDESVFPGTQREYQLYIPHGLDRSKAAAFMVFQDGVIYQAPVVFDNLIAKKQIPPLIGVFIKPGVVPAANENTLPRFNRSYEYDSITDTYSDFLIEEFLPAIETKHGIKLSADPNDAAISGNSSGGIAAFMVAWHRPDRFRRVFTGVGTYVGIHGGDRLPVLVRKFEPKPIRIFLQSGTGDNNLYCGDWWMANQMMERSFTWAGYDVNHAWGEGGHNQKHASQIFPDVMRWLWRDWQTNKEIKANPKGESKWRGYEVCSAAEDWKAVQGKCVNALKLASNAAGDVFWRERNNTTEDWLMRAASTGTPQRFGKPSKVIQDIKVGADGRLFALSQDEGGKPILIRYKQNGDEQVLDADLLSDGMAGFFHSVLSLAHSGGKPLEMEFEDGMGPGSGEVALSPDHSLIYQTSVQLPYVVSFQVKSGNVIQAGQRFTELEVDEDGESEASGLCVDTDGRLYVATSLGIQVCDQAGRVNFIIPTPKQPYDVCFGGKDLSELFIACGDKIYKRPTKVHGIVSGQMPPIKPAPPKL